MAVGSKKIRRKSNFILVLLILQNSMFLTRNLKKLYEFTVIPRFTSLLVPKNLTTYIEVHSAHTRTRK